LALYGRLGVGEGKYKKLASSRSIISCWGRQAVLAARI